MMFWQAGTVIRRTVPRQTAAVCNRGCDLSRPLLLKKVCTYSGRVMPMSWVHRVSLAALVGIFFCAGTCPGFVEVAARVDTGAVLIGDVITYEILVTYDDTIVVEKLPHGVNLTAFHIRDYRAIPKTKLANGLWQEGGQYRISVYRPGLYVIPPVPVRYHGRSGQPGELITQPITVEVKSMGVTEEDTLRGIKGPKSVPVRFPIWIWGMPAVMVLAGVAVLFAVKRRGRKSTTAVEPPATIVLDEVAEFDRIPAADLIRSGDLKLLYTLVSDAMRRYLARRYGVNSMELTLHELALSLESVGADGNDVGDMISFLERCDLVKFARFIPAHDEVETLIERAKNLVRQTQVSTVAAVSETSPENAADDRDGEGSTSV